MNVLSRIASAVGWKSSAYDSPQKLAEVFSPWIDTDAGINITPSNAIQIATVYACIRVLAESVGMLPLNLKVMSGDERKTDTENDLHWLLRRGPNDYLTAQEYKELILVHLGLRGSHYSYINRLSSGKIAELLPLNPDAVKPKLDGWKLEYNVTFPGGKTETLSADKIMHIRLFSTDGINGLSPIACGRNAIGLARATERYGSKLFANAARPAGVYSTDANLKDDQFERIKKQIDEKHTGENVHRTMILEGGLKWLSVSMKADEAQFLETRKMQRSEICGLYRVPPHMIADLDKATFSNIEHQDIAFVRHSLTPYLTRIEQRLDKDLLGNSEKSRYFKFNANALLRGDVASRGDYYTKMIQNGAMSPNEIRALEDLNPRKGGDVYLTPMNMAINGKPVESSDADKTKD